jgi:hypothetical protein
MEAFNEVLHFRPTDLSTGSDVRMDEFCYCRHILGYEESRKTLEDLFRILGRPDERSYPDDAYNGTTEELARQRVRRTFHDTYLTIDSSPVGICVR